jgi:hypothetical protein
VTQFKESGLLVAALIEMGFAREQIEVNQTAKQLFDYHGCATKYLDATGDKAEIIIRRQHVGSAANDIGFRRNENGRFEAIISAFDSGSNCYNSEWLGKLTGAYARQGVIAKMQKQGYRYVPDSARKNGKTELVFVQA